MQQNNALAGGAVPFLCRINTRTGLPMSRQELEEEHREWQAEQERVAREWDKQAAERDKEADVLATRLGEEHWRVQKMRSEAYAAKLQAHVWRKDAKLPTTRPREPWM